MKVFVPELKVRKYLLKDRRKSGFFLRFGYSLEDWTRLKEDIQAIGEGRRPKFIEETSYGERFEIQAEITAPNGRLIKITTGWMVLHEDRETIRFVTAYPT
jgi:hypothetical protein